MFNNQASNEKRAIINSRASLSLYLKSLEKIGFEYEKGQRTWELIKDINVYTKRLKSELNKLKLKGKLGDPAFAQFLEKVKKLEKECDAVIALTSTDLRQEKINSIKQALKTLIVKLGEI